MRRARGIWLGILAFALVVASSAAAGGPDTTRPAGGPGLTFNVDSEADLIDIQPGNGHCVASNGKCTLRAAIMETNKLTGDDLVNVPAGHYVLSLMGGGPDERHGDLDTTDDLTLSGAGARITVIDANQIDRVIQSSADLMISGVTIENGQVADEGGGIWALNSLKVESSIVRNNTALLDIGGGIWAQDFLTLSNSTVYGNEATTNCSMAPCNVGIGGGIFVGNIALPAFLNISNSTIHGNKASRQAGLYLNDVGIRLVTGSTISGNTNTIPGNGSAGIGGTTPDLERTIIAGNNAGPDCEEGNSNGHNLDSDDSCGLSAVAGDGDVPNGDPKLAPLRYNGGLTLTRALRAGSDAFNAAGACTGSDQRGYARPQGAACDIGAFEARICFGRPETVSGNNQSETLNGTAGIDAIVGGGGNDTLNGLDGDDRLCGEDGDDELKGGAGADRFNGGDGTDECRGGPNADILPATGCETTISIP
ncbi:MAG: choice-of-anchor Q domain-containing protein [Dehalococcoidia bacterium]